METRGSTHYEENLLNFMKYIFTVRSISKVRSCHPALTVFGQRVTLVDMIDLRLHHKK